MSQVFSTRAPVCGNCLHFENDPAAIERECAGLTALGSGFASVRANDGFCRLHDLYVSTRDTCPSHAKFGRAR